MAVVLSIVFFAAMFMGTGWGVLLVNPDVNDPDAVRTVCGLPVIYLWGLLWFVVQVVVVGLAYRFVWVGDDDDRTR